MTKTTSKKPVKHEDIPKGYGALMAMHPLRPIHDDIEMENATEIIDMMAGHALNADQEDYLDALSTLVEAYEAKHYPIEPTMGALDILRALLADHGMGASDLARLLGVHRSLGSKILRGERELSKDHIRKLCDRFKVSADLFLQP